MFKEEKIRLDNFGDCVTVTDKPFERFFREAKEEKIIENDYVTEMDKKAWDRWILALSALN